MNTQSRKSIRLLTQEIDMKKTALKNDCFKFGAQKKTRTSTSLRTLVPETSASTNSAIWALIFTIICCKVSQMN